MIIDKKQLISLLIDKTGLGADQVEDQLTELINRIQQAAQAGKTFEIEGFGTFSMEEGTLQFKPSDMLETEINNKYAGMKPIELIGAFKEPEGDEVPEVTEEPDMDDARWAFDEAATDKREKGTGEPIEAAEASSEPDGAEPNAEEVYEQIFGKSKLGRVPTSQQEVPSEPDADEKEPKKDTLGRLLVAAVVVIALGVGGWVVYDLGFAGINETSQWAQSSPQQAQTRTVPTGDAQPEGQGLSSPENEEVSEPEQQNSVVNEESRPNQTEEQPQSRFGLKGELNQAAGGYTIVVHSLRSVQKAENIRKDFQDAGFRALLTQAEVRGSTFYRVGIGQFETIGDAQQALNEIPDRYTDNNFIKRIR